MLNGLVKAIDLTKRASQASFKPPTGAELTTFAAPTALSWMFGSPIVGIAGTGAIGSVARAYESKPIRNILLKLSREKSEDVQKDLIEQLSPLIQSFRQQSTEKGE